MRTMRCGRAGRRWRCGRRSPGLGIEGRIGVSTGEVVTGTEERLATGDALNVAARLQQAAAPGEVLIAEATRALVGDAVDVEPVEPLALKGKSEPVRRVPAARARARRRSGGTTRCSSVASASWRCWARRGGGLGRSGVVSWSRSSVTRVSASRGSRRRRWRRSRRGSCAAAAFRTGSGSPTGRSWRWSSSSTRCPSDPAAAAAIRSLLGESEAGTSAEEIALGVPQAARGAGAARRRVRRHSVGRGDVPRPGRARRAALRAAPRSCCSAWPARSCSTAAPPGR